MFNLLGTTPSRPAIKALKTSLVAPVTGLFDRCTDEGPLMFSHNV